MSKNPTPVQGNGPNGPMTPPQQVQVRVAGQYVKDLSFESPNIGKLITNPPESPNLNVEINVGAGSLGPDLYESAIEFKARASAKDVLIYEFEIVYAGAFHIENLPPQAMEPMLYVNCPALLFPFLRRIIADLTREGGFPPLLLDPVDFGALYMRKKQAAASSPGNPPSGTA